MRALAIVGPRASQKQVERFRDSRCELVVLQSPSADAVRDALRDRVDVVLVFGGDGTLNRHLGQLAKTDLAVMAVPAGSGNDLARAAGMPNVDAAAKVWRRFLSGSANMQGVDLGAIFSASLSLPGPRYFSCCANIGLDADAARRTDAMPDWMKSRGGYFIGGLMALVAYRPTEIAYTAGGRQHPERGWFLSVSNTPTFGGGLKIAPQARINDGLLDVTFASAERFSRPSLARNFPKLFSGEHVALAGLDIFTAQHIDVRTDTPQPVYADGEYIAETPCRIEVARGALRLIMA